MRLRSRASLVVAMLERVQHPQCEEDKAGKVWPRRDTEHSTTHRDSASCTQGGPDCGDEEDRCHGHWRLPLAARSVPLSMAAPGAAQRSTPHPQGEERKVLEAQVRYEVLNSIHLASERFACNVGSSFFFLACLRRSISSRRIFSSFSPSLSSFACFRLSISARSALSSATSFSSFSCWRRLIWARNSSSCASKRCFRSSMARCWLCAAAARSAMRSW
mmetsp:Transcript_114621/g.355986  ORF Transcript_114621/g.355986 Transcript_114621/m.355986 type:complete len:218 (-) Transcript_114621:1287-1940(-)